MKIHCQRQCKMRMRESRLALNGHGEISLNLLVRIITSCSSRLPVTAVASTAKHAILISALP